MSFIVWEFNFLRSIPSRKVPSFFLTKTTKLAYGLFDLHIAPMPPFLLGVFLLPQTGEVVYIYIIP